MYPVRSLPMVDLPPRGRGRAAPLRFGTRRYGQPCSSSIREGHGIMLRTSQTSRP